MRAIIIVLALAVPLAACGESNPTFGSGGWQEGDVPEAVPVGEAPEADAPAVPEQTAERPARPTAPEPAVEAGAEMPAPTEPSRAAARPDPEPAPPPVPSPEPVPDPHAGHDMSVHTPPVTPQ